jgi:RES domain-containing protein
MSEYVAIELEFHDRLIEALNAKSLPADWTEEPPPPSTMKIGDRWVKERRSTVLQLPGAIIPSESNYLLNPSHRDFQKITIRKPAAFSFDPRLV